MLLVMKLDQYMGSVPDAGRTNGDIYFSVKFLVEVVSSQPFSQKVL